MGQVSQKGLTNAADKHILSEESKTQMYKRLEEAQVISVQLQGCTTTWI